MSLNDICVYIPAWFGSIASVLTGLLGYECSLPLMSSNEEGPFGSILENIPLTSWVYTNVLMKIVAVILKGITSVFGTDFGLSTRSVVPSIAKTNNIVDGSSPAVEIGLIAAMIMAIVPAHMMRSVGGGYDNESIANTAMTMTFYFWVRALRGGVHHDSWRTIVWAALTGVAYFYVSVALFMVLGQRNSVLFCHI